jgi:hypothetical protein
VPGEDDACTTAMRNSSGSRTHFEGSDADQPPFADIATGVSTSGSRQNDRRSALDRTQGAPRKLIACERFRAGLRGLIAITSSVKLPRMPVADCFRGNSSAE